MSARPYLSLRTLTAVTLACSLAGPSTAHAQNRRRLFPRIFRQNQPTGYSGYSQPAPQVPAPQPTAVSAPASVATPTGDLNPNLTSDPVALQAIVRDLVRRYGELSEAYATERMRTTDLQAQVQDAGLQGSHAAQLASTRLAEVQAELAACQGEVAPTSTPAPSLRASAPASQGSAPSLFGIPSDSATSSPPLASPGGVPPAQTATVARAALAAASPTSPTPVSTSKPLLPVQSADAGLRTIGKTVAGLGESKSLGGHVLDTAGGLVTAGAQNLRTVVETPVRGVNAVVDASGEMIRADAAALQRLGQGTYDAQRQAVQGATKVVQGLSEPKSIGQHIQDTAVQGTSTALNSAATFGSGVVGAAKEHFTGMGRAANDFFWRTLGY